MNRPKTNTYPKYYLISGYGIIAGTIGPKPWHPVFMTQVDIPILITYDIFNYYCQASTDFLPSQFPHPQVDLVLHCTWSDFWNAQTGWLMLRGLFHQIMYIMKFMAAYTSVTISRWVTRRYSMACAMYCIMNHNVWNRTRDLASQSLFASSLISSSVSKMNNS